MSSYMGATAYSSWYRATCQDGTTVEIDTSHIEVMHLETRSVEMLSGRRWFLAGPDFTFLYKLLTGHNLEAKKSEGN